MTPSEVCKLVSSIEFTPDRIRAINQHLRGRADSINQSNNEYRLGFRSKSHQRLNNLAFILNLITHLNQPIRLKICTRYFMGCQMIKFTRCTKILLCFEIKQLTSIRMIVIEILHILHSQSYIRFDYDLIMYLFSLDYDMRFKKK